MNDTEKLTIGAAVKDLYASISFQEGKEPDIALLRSLFHPEGMLTSMTDRGPSVMRLETFVSLFREQMEAGYINAFLEKEIAARIETFGNIAQVFSTYEAIITGPEEAQKVRGINSIQLFKQDGRWRVLSILWDEEREERVIPEDYLP